MRDERGSFARTFCCDEFSKNGLVNTFVQHSVSHSKHRHTLRGMHFQTAPYQEVKVVSCLQGAIWDVALDLRNGSPTFGKWTAEELTAGNGKRLYIPKGFAHGFLSLSNDAVVSYLISERYNPEASSGVSYDDPAFAIQWPARPAVISEKDLSWPRLAKVEETSGVA